jgi:cytochrome c oxidase cbb3-type subunit 3
MILLNCIAQAEEITKQDQRASSPRAEAAHETTDAGATPSRGAAVYEEHCSVCHWIGLAQAPKLGDVEAWAPRIAQGVEVLYGHALNGFMNMPAKGGNTNLSDDEVREAVDYMLDSVK